MKEQPPTPASDGGEFLLPPSVCALKYRQLIETLHEGIWVIDPDAFTTFVNPRMAEMLGYASDDMLGRHLFSFMDDQGIRIAEYNLKRRKQGIGEQHEFEFIRRDGSRIHVGKNGDEKQCRDYPLRHNQPAY
jgi:PAS domain S-box-containing protein